jgi:predicted neuraminidase
MDHRDILDLASLIDDGALYRPPQDDGRIEAFIPPAGPENHAANLAALPNGDLLCAWFAGSAEGAGDIRIALSRLPHGASRWTAPQWVSQDSGRSEQNPILFCTPEGDLWLLYTSQQTRGCSRAEWQRRVAAGEAAGSYTMQWTAVIKRRISHDGGHTWGPVEMLMDRPSSFCRQPPIVMSNGEWLLPMYYSIRDEAAHGADYTVIQISSDQGQTWREHPVPHSRGRVHASVIELEAGRLLAFFRSRAADRIYISRADDYGRTWSVPQRTALPNNNASIQALHLANGHIALVYNAYSANDDATRTLWPRRRYPLAIALSEDGGRAWPYQRHIDPSDGFCGPANQDLNRRCAYPSILQTPDSRLHVAYSYRGRQCIKYVRFDETWVRDRCYTRYT